jgi:lipopolysaccharide biosynthesis regulator YciM
VNLLFDNQIEVLVMNRERKDLALATWRKLLESPETRMNASEQYDELLRLADEFQHKGIIDRDERKDLVWEATSHYARAVEQVGCLDNRSTA